MLVALRWLIAVVVLCEARHWDADRMLPNERNSLDDCRSRFHELIAAGAAAPAYGKPALIKEFAHMGAIGWTQTDGKVLWHCGGTLIWMDYVLTAAHCIVDHRDVRPDIVRFGDLNLETDDDDEYAQQYKIIQIFRHPLHRFGVKYHDIALLKLESSVRLHDTVCPACLWVNDEIRFKELVATGWGSTGQFEERTPSLLKVSLKPIANSKCETFYYSELVRGLKTGLHENHLCAVDEKMDTCEGDSGGPLQVKLQHHRSLTPFVVAVTSFGLPCGLSNPGVYTKIAPYHDWIVSTMRQNGAAVQGFQHRLFPTRKVL
ncbi:AAEL005654-PA [Aedes aegypti]|uniref:AAEL005654-PA n=1 Tax=Aedes aegypti TaxID=7159 RepID=Q179G3_AEDAE|nr:AAEL005654-PA [Aedes aegypti]